MALNFERSVTGRRSLAYIDAAAKEQQIEYDLTETGLNREALIQLWDACLAFDAGDERYTNETLQAICDNLLDASRVSILQGVRQREPLDIKEYQRLFNHNHEMLHMVDTPYAAPKGVELTISWTLASDNDTVLHLTPGLQMKLPFEGVKENAEAM